MKIGRPRKYKTKKALKGAIERYFNSILRTMPALDENKKVITNDAGEEMTVQRFIRPPTISGLCLHLGIDRSTWQNYCDAEKHPEFTEITMMTSGVIETYLEEELLTRAKPQGIIFNLQNNYGWKEKKNVDVEGVSSISVNVKEVEGKSKE